LAFCRVAGLRGVEKDLFLIKAVLGSKYPTGVSHRSVPIIGDFFTALFLLSGWGFGLTDFWLKGDGLKLGGLSVVYHI